MDAHHLATIRGAFLGSISSSNGSRSGYCTLTARVLVSSAIVRLWKRKKRKQFSILQKKSSSSYSKKARERKSSNQIKMSFRVSYFQWRKEIVVAFTSSAMLCRIFRCTDAFTWFCPVTSSAVNLQFLTIPIIITTQPDKNVSISTIKETWIKRLYYTLSLRILWARHLERTHEGLEPTTGCKLVMRQAKQLRLYCIPTTRIKPCKLQKQIKLNPSSTMMQEREREIYFLNMVVRMDHEQDSQSRARQVRRAGEVSLSCKLQSRKSKKGKESSQWREFALDCKRIREELGFPLYRQN